MTPCIVTAWSDLGFQPTADQPACLPREQFRWYGEQIKEAVGPENVVMFWDYPFRDCWVAKEFDLNTLTPNNPTPQDRFADSWQHLRCNAIQHERTTWAMQAKAARPDVDVWLWLDIGILKQGAWRNNPVTQDSIKRFFDRVKATPLLDDIPFPGITPRQSVYPTGNVWRFCGSTHIWPLKYLSQIDAAYKATLRQWIAACKTLPLDLPIWALVETNSKLPFRQYPAEYDASQLDNYELTAWQNAGML
jgi:hypothetical protein